jgi:hypothetical protein
MIGQALLTGMEFWRNAFLKVPQGCSKVQGDSSRMKIFSRLRQHRIGTDLAAHCR